MLEAETWMKKRLSPGKSILDRETLSARVVNRMSLACLEEGGWRNQVYEWLWICVWSPGFILRLTESFMLGHCVTYNVSQWSILCGSLDCS